MFLKRKKEYSSYDKYKNGILFKINLESYLVPQGLCQVESYTFISCYTINDEKSRVCMFNKNGKLLKEIVLNNKSHVGGIGYDKKHSLIWICSSNGRVNSYRYTEFIKGDISSEKSYAVCDSSLGGSVLLEDGKMVSSYLTVYSNRLYIGSFNKKTNGLVKVFDIINDNYNISLKYVCEFTVPNKIQGITFYERNNILYMFLSQSYTRIKDSKILVYKYSKDIENYENIKFSFNLPPMLEQIVNINGELLLLFESFANKYSYNARVVVDDIVILNIDDILKDSSLLLR